MTIGLCGSSWSQQAILRYFRLRQLGYARRVRCALTTWV
jgi:hypothetical protein